MTGLQYLWRTPRPGRGRLAHTGGMAFSDDDVRAWVDLAARMYEITVPDELARRTQHAAANLMSASGFLDAPSEVMEMFDNFIEVGYAQALRDVEDGYYDDEIIEWRPDLAES